MRVDQTASRVMKSVCGLVNTGARIMVSQTALATTGILQEINQDNIQFGQGRGLASYQTHNICKMLDIPYFDVQVRKIKTLLCLKFTLNNKRNAAFPL